MNGAVSRICLINTPIHGGAAARDSEEKPFETVSLPLHSYTPMNGGVNEKIQFIGPLPLRLAGLCFSLRRLLQLQSPYVDSYNELGF